MLSCVTCATARDHVTRQHKRREEATREDDEYGELSTTVASVKSEPTEDVAAEHRCSRQEQLWTATNDAHSQGTVRMSEEMNCAAARG